MSPAAGELVLRVRVNQMRTPDFAILAACGFDAPEGRDETIAVAASGTVGRRACAT